MSADEESHVSTEVRELGLGSLDGSHSDYDSVREECQNRAGYYSDDEGATGSISGLTDQVLKASCPLDTHIL
jgi:hypothetical protein